MQESHSVIIVGAGPIGIACGIEATLRDMDAVVLEKGCIAHSIYSYPPQLVFFSTPRLLELGGIPFITAGPKPTRGEALYYYRRLTEHFGLDVRTYERVEDIRSTGDHEYTVRTSKDRLYTARFVVLATGCYDHANHLGIPGEELPKVSHYYKEPHAFYRQKVAVVGGQNSAVEAALELWRTGAEVTLIHRRSSLGDAVKYWVRPDIENRIKEGSIRAILEAKVERIETDHVLVRRGDRETLRIENDFVFLLTGYHADFDFLKRAGIVFEEGSQKPLNDPATLETNVPGVYVAGVVVGGTEGGKLFIENTRYHAKLIFQDIQRKLAATGDDET